MSSHPTITLELDDATYGHLTTAFLDYSHELIDRAGATPENADDLQRSAKEDETLRLKIEAALDPTPAL